ncbi:zinc finger domain containing protein [Entamoeba histolytica HM-1:IMSS-B]|uniref:Zinc finger domain containing protein n=5 Tax=Entamoeba histolytica TaxID=5759 RepID=C4M4Q4_ENTH1|nr:zinc finger domain containing protein [Entamoeba histolytica HM-1:IMSS]EMD47106.1 zinc finger domain containing protein [Entamoeba histolytica KU27]EMH77520.1 zinc finger domain containing protein [Entamoeba histolytica HM-1:IMSS-B]ENY62630.1 zinc finger domain containing protein [Entamoeba histolytica HM-1:IMSS-A]GAT96348.1 zinc finger domain containing protein [Entamoeba histolytica]EAL47580.1 zinc finger domain containing protein [Entamoeba histolytica HM-1:IMSS]|eukprot:XP_652966.1 zinc finger domain containing protein [Entamoeba histolytica HM-1:IMSS]
MDQQKQVIEIDSDNESVGSCHHENDDSEVEIVGVQQLNPQEEIERQIRMNGQTRYFIPISALNDLGTNTITPSIYYNDGFDTETSEELFDEDSDDFQENNFNRITYFPSISLVTNQSQRNLFYNFLHRSYAERSHRINSRQVSEIPDWMKSPKKEAKPQEKKEKGVAEEDGLKCGICWDTSSDVVSTACGHIFCRSCMCELFKNKETVECPFCRTQLTKKDVHRLFFNH